MVVVPPIYFTQTEQGKRQKDVIFAWLNLQAAVNFELNTLNPTIKREQLLTSFKDLIWQCLKEQSRYGDQLCLASISSYNGFPAYYLSFYFYNDALTALKVVYRADYHQQLRSHIDQQLGAAEHTAKLITETPNANPLLQWQTLHGKVFLLQTLQENDESSLLWLAKIKQKNSLSN